MLEVVPRATACGILNGELTMANHNMIIEPQPPPRNWRIAAVVFTFLSVLGFLVSFGVIWWLDEHRPPKIWWDGDKLGGS